MELSFSNCHRPHAKAAAISTLLFQCFIILPALWFYIIYYILVKIKFTLCLIPTQTAALQPHAPSIQYHQEQRKIPEHGSWFLQWLLPPAPMTRITQVWAPPTQQAKARNWHQPTNKRNSETVWVSSPSFKVSNRITVLWKLKLCLDRRDTECWILIALAY